MIACFVLNHTTALFVNYKTIELFGLLITSPKGRHSLKEFSLPRR